MMWRRSQFIALGLAGLVCSVGLAQTQPAPPPDLSHGLFDGWWAGDGLFEKSATRLPADQREKLMRLVELPQQLPTYKRAWCPHTLWVIVGHADVAEGSKKTQAALALQRAEYVASLVSSYGVPSAHICTFDRGAKQPVVGYPNSRVEIEVRCSAVPPLEEVMRCNSQMKQRPNKSARADTQHQAAASPRLLRAGGLRR